VYLRVTGSEFETLEHSLGAANANANENVPIRKHETIAVEPL